jgi:hypothetical protein
MVPEVGLEPTRSNAPGDFESDSRLDRAAAQVEVKAQNALKDNDLGRFLCFRLSTIDTV